MTMEQSLPLPARPEIPDDPELAGADDRAWRDLLARLSRQSVAKHFDAYEDVAWDDPSYQVDPEDPRFELIALDPLGGTDWYRSQPQPLRARMGLHRFATFMKVGVQFENVLKRGLLTFAETLPNDSPEFRYVYHEIAEETQHSLMFQEFVNRARLPVQGLTGFVSFASGFVPRFARVHPELFFLFVLGGEAPIDAVQRRMLRTATLHPLVRRVMHIHVTEEARHLCFARAYLTEHAPDLGALQRLRIHLSAPFILATTAQAMLQLPQALARQYGVPSRVMREAYEGSLHREQLLEGLLPIANLCDSLGFIPRAFGGVWRRLGIAQSSVAMLPGGNTTRDNGVAKPDACPST
jgi:hypothetical protein